MPKKPTHQLSVNHQDRGTGLNVRPQLRAGEDNPIQFVSPVNFQEPIPAKKNCCG